MSPYVFHTRIAYADIGQDLYLSLSGAMRMMQEAAIIHSDLSGYSVMDVERTRVVWMLVQWRVRMVGKAKWNEAVEVVTWPQTMEKFSAYFGSKVVMLHSSLCLTERYDQWKRIRESSFLSSSASSWSVGTEGKVAP